MRFSAVSPYNASSEARSSPTRLWSTTAPSGTASRCQACISRVDQKVAIARKLDEVGVHQIEAGFPAVSDTEREAVKKIAGLGLNADILCLSRTLQSDIDAAIDCDVDMVLLFVATSELHLKYKLKMSPRGGAREGGAGASSTPASTGSRRA